MKCRLDISKVVTPDGNGINDEWIITNVEKFKDNKVVVVDRWGGVIFTGTATIIKTSCGAAQIGVAGPFQPALTSLLLP